MANVTESAFPCKHLKKQELRNDECAKREGDVSVYFPVHSSGNRRARFRLIISPIKQSGKTGRHIIEVKHIGIPF